MLNCIPPLIVFFLQLFHLNFQNTNFEYADLCHVTGVMTSVVHECNEAYSIDNQDTDPYGIGWTEFQGNSTVNNSRTEYRFQSWSDLDSYPIVGTQALYSGGGYLAELKGNLPELLEYLKTLQSENWVDVYTRAVFIEFTVYNAYVNLFAVVSYWVEFLPTNGIETYYIIDVVNLLGYFSQAMLLQVVCQGLFVAFVLFFIVKEIRNLIKQKTRYFFQVWNWVEMTIIGLSIAGVAIYCYRYFETLRLVGIFAETGGNTYINFQYVDMWHQLLLAMAGFLVFFSTLKFIKILRFNKKIGLISSTLKHASAQLSAFAFCFLTIFLAFVGFFFLVFSSQLTEFMTVISSLQMCFEMLVGKFSFSDMVKSSPVLGPLFFFIYIIVVFCILVNMFVIILNKSFAIVREDISKQSNEYEIIDFMVSSFLKWSGIGSVLQSMGVMKKPESSNDLDNDEKPIRVDNYSLQRIEQFPSRLDRLMETICNMYFNYAQIDENQAPQCKEGEKMMKKLSADSKQAMKPQGKQFLAGRSLPEVEEILHDSKY